MSGIYLIVSIFLYFFAPSKYSYFFCVVITVLYLVQVLPFLVNKSQGNYLNFYTAFFFSFFFINFFYPVVIYPIDPEFFSIFSVPFNEDFINKGTALAQVCSSSLILGAYSIRIPKIKYLNPINFEYYYNYRSVAYVTFFFFFLFVVTVGRDFLSGNFAGKSFLSGYILQILTCLFILTPLFFFKYYYFIKRRNFFWMVVTAYILLFLFTGDRGPALSLILIISALYAIYVNEIPKKFLIVFALSGILLMHMVGIGRSVDIDSDGNIASRAVSNFDADSYLEISRSFVVNTRNLYVGIEFVETQGINWGTTSLFNSLVSIIPYSQSLVEKIFGLEFTTSAFFFTRLAFGPNPSYGIGTNLVADVFISFGFYGSIFLFLLFGRLIEYHRRRMLMTHNLFSSIVYFSLFSFSIYYPRTGLFMPLKIIIWTYVIFLLLKFFKILTPIDNSGEISKSDL